MALAPGSCEPRGRVKSFLTYAPNPLSAAVHILEHTDSDVWNVARDDDLVRDAPLAGHRMRIMIRLARAACAGLLLIGLVTGCMSPSGNTVEEKRQAVQQMRADTLAALYEIHPEARNAIASAVGYGTFTNIGVYLFLLSTASGWGVVHDQQTGTDTYMKMYSVGIGIGLGAKDFRGVFVFTERGALDSFVARGWQAGAQADAAAKAGEKGEAFAGAIDVAPGIKLYQITESGLALMATIQGTKYWKDDDLN